MEGAAQQVRTPCPFFYVTKAETPCSTLFLNCNYPLIPLLIFYRHLQAIEAERLPQVLAIQHSDEDEEGDYDEEEDDFCGIGADSTDEEDEEEKCCDGQSTASPDSSFQSLSPGELSLNEQFY